MQQLLQRDNDALGELIFSFEWALGRGDPNQSEADVLSTLVSEGHASSSADAVPVYTHLFAFVFRLLTKPGPKVSTIDALAAELASPSIPPNQRGILDEIKGEIEALKKDVGSIKRRLDLQNDEVNVLKQTVEMIGKSYGFENVFALSAATLSTDVPELVSPRADRRVLVDALLARVEADGVVVLVGEPGSGKTQLLRLLTDKASPGTIWLNIPRMSTEAQANLLIDSLIRYLAPEAKGTSLRDRYAAPCRLSQVRSS